QRQRQKREQMQRQEQMRGFFAALRMTRREGVRGREESLSRLHEEGDGYGMADGSAGGGYGVGIGACRRTGVVDGWALFDAADGWDAHGQEKCEEACSLYFEIADGEFADAAAA